jgi:tRNA threonylcarbamoyladenosine biosynthesis protein TsaE
MSRRNPTPETYVRTTYGLWGFRILLEKGRKNGMLDGMEYHSHSIQETQEIAATIARETVERPTTSGAQVFALEGDLGAGKTTFVQGFLTSLGVTDKVKSPTFLLMKRYSAKGRDVYHLDCYRLMGSQDLAPLEIDIIFKNPQAIILVEWAERIADILPPNHTTIRIEHLSDHERKIIIS